MEERTKKETRESSDDSLVDSINIGSAAKGVNLKAYTDFTNIGLTEKKLEGLLKARAFLKTMGMIE